MEKDIKKPVKVIGTVNNIQDMILLNKQSSVRLTERAIKRQSKKKQRKKNKKL